MRAPESSGSDPASQETSSAAVPGPSVRADAASVLDQWRDGLRAVVPAGERVSGRAVALFAALVAAAIVVGALAFGLSQGGSGEDVTAPPAVVAVAPATTRPERSPGTTPAELLVHAAGAVQRPGLYRLAPGSRVADLLGAAGGLTPDADSDRVNLAAPLADGGRLYVPRRSEPAPPAVVAPDGGAPLPPASSPDAGPPASRAGPVNINTAGAAELDSLPGVGPATAAAIVDYRNQRGPFRSVEDLMKVRGIGKAKLDELRSLVTT